MIAAFKDTSFACTGTADAVEARLTTALDDYVRRYSPRQFRVTLRRQLFLQRSAPVIATIDVLEHAEGVQLRCRFAPSPSVAAMAATTFAMLAFVFPLMSGSRFFDSLPRLVAYAAGALALALINGVTMLWFVRPQREELLDRLAQVAKSSSPPATV